MQNPNKIFVLNTTKDTGFESKRKQVIIIAAKDKETAAQYLKDKLNFDGNPNDLIWLIGTNHPTLYDQTGMFVLNRQAKVLYNTSINIPD